MNNLEKLPQHNIGKIVYRIAYIALCLENSAHGRSLFNELEMVPSIDHEYVQFGSPDWFWENHLNSFALQVEPARYIRLDQATIEHQEALHVQKVRDQFYIRLLELTKSL